MANEEQQILTKKQRLELKRQEKMEQSNKSAKANRVKKISIWVAIVIVLAGVGWLIFYSNNHQITNVPPDNDPTYGAANPKLTITEFSDFSCPACKLAAPAIREAVSAYSDKVQLVYNDFNIGHQWSEKSAEAGECAFNQGKFWEFYDLVFAKQDEWADASDAIDKFKTYAKDIGLDVNQFSSCLDSSETADKVAYDMKEGQAKKIVSTPTFFIGNQEVIGAKTAEEFKSLIAAALK